MRPSGEGQDMGRMGRRRLGGTGGAGEARPEQGQGLEVGRRGREPRESIVPAHGYGHPGHSGHGGDPQGMHWGGPRWAVIEQSKMT